MHLPAYIEQGVYIASQFIAFFLCDFYTRTELTQFNMQNIIFMCYTAYVY